MSGNPILGQHVNHWTDAARGTVRAAPGAVLKILDTAVDRDEIKRYKDARPDGLVVFRKVMPDESLANVKDRVARLMFSCALIEDLVDVIETPWNESNQTGVALSAYADATNEAVNLIESYGHSTSIGHFSEGNPPDLAGDWPRFHVALSTSKRRKWLDLHEYSAPTMQTGAPWHCLRWGTVYAALPPELRRDRLGGEAGIDGGALDPPIQKKGWKTFAKTGAAYAPQLRWYAEGCQALAAKYNVAVKVAVFCCGNFGDWDDFDVAGVAEIEALYRDAMGAPPTEPPLVTHPPTLDPSKIYTFSQWQHAAADNLITTGHGSDPRDGTAFTAHLKALGADYTRPTDYGYPFPKEAATG